jgi:non-heme chloroperoxidase
MAFVTVGHENSTAIDLFYEDRGAGAPVVLVHGYPLASGSWERQVTALVEEGHRVITYDRRGSGRSSQPAYGYDWDTLANDLSVLMTTLDLRQTVIAGHSVGTGDVMRYLRKFGSQRVTRAALVAPLGPGPQSAPTAYSLIGNEQREGFEDRFADLADIVTDYYNSDSLLDGRVSADVVRHSWNVSASGAPQILSLFPAALATDFRADLDAIDVPLLVVIAGDDRLLPRLDADRRAFFTVAMSETVVIPKAPHGLLWTHGREVNAALLEFVDG